MAGGGTIVYGRINQMSGPPLAVDDQWGEQTVSRPDQLFVFGSQVYVKCERRHIRNRWEPPH